METTSTVHYKLIAPMAFINTIDQSQFDNRGAADQMLSYAKSHYAGNEEVLKTLKVERVTTIVEQDSDSEVDFLAWAAKGLRENEHTRIHWGICPFVSFGTIHTEQMVRAQTYWDRNGEEPKESMNAGENYETISGILDELIDKHDMDVNRAYDELKDRIGSEHYYQFINSLSNSLDDAHLKAESIETLQKEDANVEPFISREKGGKMRRANQ